LPQRSYAVAGEEQEGEVEPIAKIIGGNLKRGRRRAGLSQDDVAWKSGLHRTEVSLIELGKRTPRVDTLVRFANAIGITPADAFKGAWPTDAPEDGA
jgi:transcriptional regulator with XRE-family HTH domain